MHDAAHCSISARAHTHPAQQASTCAGTIQTCLRLCAPTQRVKTHQNKTLLPFLLAAAIDTAAAARRRSRSNPMALLLRRSAALASRSIYAAAVSSASTTVHRLPAVGSLAGAAELTPCQLFFLEARRGFAKGKKSSKLSVPFIDAVINQLSSVWVPS